MDGGREIVYYIFRARGYGVKKNGSRMTTVRIPAADSKANKHMHELRHVAILLSYESFLAFFLFTLGTLLIVHQSRVVASGCGLWVALHSDVIRHAQGSLFVLRLLRNSLTQTQRGVVGYIRTILFVLETIL